MRRSAVIGLASILLTTSLATATGAGRPLAVGDRAPDFTLVDQHGKPVRLSDRLAARQYIVLAFYVKAFTPG
ncbi:MAG: redoxin domain-containing protein [Candidatus Rokubacteria bacterium]|nr:redoxin domain-containing protein [Candidatus Rokubacteria bacterium]